MRINCPFYGYSMFMTTMDPRRSMPFLLMPTNGNQCGLITTSHAPCHMEINDLPIDWESCPHIGDVQARERR
jgi:hypothetical protein